MSIQPVRVAKAADGNYLVLANGHRIKLPATTGGGGTTPPTSHSHAEYALVDHGHEGGGGGTAPNEVTISTGPTPTDGTELWLDLDETAEGALDDLYVNESGDGMTGPLEIVVSGPGGGGATPNLRLVRDTAPELHFHKRSQAAGQQKWKMYVSGPANETGATPASLSFASLSDDEMTNLATLRMFRDGRMLLGANPQGAMDAATKGYVDGLARYAYGTACFTAATGWADYGGSFQIRAARFGQVVTLQGLAKRTGAGITIGSTLVTVGTLASDFWPSGSATASTTVASTGQTIRMDVNSAGGVVIRNYASSPLIVTGDWFSLLCSFVGA